MLVVCVCIVAAAARALANSTAPAQAAPDKFVNNLRNHLQLNNDDYAERLSGGRRQGLPDLAPPAIPWPLPPEARRKTDGPPSQQSVRSLAPQLLSTFPDDLPAVDPNRLQRELLKAPPAIPSPRSRYPLPPPSVPPPPMVPRAENRNVNNLEKLKNFVQSNKNMLRNYLNKKNLKLANENVSVAPGEVWGGDDKGAVWGGQGDVPAVREPVRAVAPLTVQPDGSLRKHRWPVNPDVRLHRPMPQHQRHSQKGGRAQRRDQRWGGGSDGGDTGNQPSAVQRMRSYNFGSGEEPELDMAPVKGGRADKLRNKGQLCHRHVLLPEGPKYDSRGNIYLMEFNSSTFGTSYKNTKMPKLVLPRCCNCCRKSVLGCE